MIPVRLQEIVECFDPDEMELMATAKTEELKTEREQWVARKFFLKEAPMKTDGGLCFLAWGPTADDFVHVGNRGFRQAESFVSSQIDRIESLSNKMKRIMNIAFPPPAVETKGRLDAEEVKGRVDMRELIESYGLPPPTNNRRTMPCPFHNDKRPSFSVNYEEGLYFCHTGCGGGDSIQFVMKMESCDFMTALRKLNDIFP